MVRLNYDFYVYIMASVSNVIYIGVTNNLIRRVEEHKDEITEGFTKQYKCQKLVYYEHYTDIKNAIHREKEIKGWRRDKKLKLINTLNPTWKDLYWELTDRDPSPPAKGDSG